MLQTLIMQDCNATGDILLLDVDKLAKTAQHFPSDREQYGGNYWNGAVMKALQN